MNACGASGASSAVDETFTTSELTVILQNCLRPVS